MVKIPWTLVHKQKSYRRKYSPTLSARSMYKLAQFHSPRGSRVRFSGHSPDCVSAIGISTISRTCGAAPGGLMLGSVPIFLVFYIFILSLFVLFWVLLPSFILMSAQYFATAPPKRLHCGAALIITRQRRVHGRAAYTTQNIRAC